MPRPRLSTLFGLLAVLVVVIASFVTARRVEAAAPIYLPPTAGSAGTAPHLTA